MGLLALVLGSLLAVAAPPQTEALPAGDTLVVIEDGRAPLVELRLLLPAGQASPWWRRSGAVAAWHLLLADARLADVADVALSHDDWSTTLVARSRKAELSDTLAILAERLQGGTLDRAVLQRWRRGMAEPPWAREADPRRALQRFLGRLLLAPGDPRRAPQAASSLWLRRVQQAAVLLPRLPGRVLGLAGAISMAEARQAAAQLLPAPVRRLPPELAPPIPPPGPEARSDGPGMREAQARIPGQGRSWVIVARRSLALGDPDVPLLRLALHALAGAGRSRLYTRLRHEEELIYALDVVPGIAPTPDVLLIATSCSPRVQEAVALAARDEVARFAQVGMAEAELIAARAALAQVAALADGDPARALEAAVEAVRHGRSPESVAQERARTATASLEELNGFIADFFAPERLILVRALAGPDWWLE